MVRKIKNNNIVLFGLMLALALFFGKVSRDLLSYSGLEKNQFLLSFWFYSILSLVIHVALSLLGSLFLGMVQGMTFVSINFFSFEVIKTEGNYKFVRTKIPGIISSCWLKPGDREQRFCYAGFYLGGVIVTIISLLTCFFIGKLTIFSFSFMVMGIVMLLNSITPLTINGVNMVRIAKKSAKEEALLYNNLVAHSDLVSGSSFLALDEASFISLSSQNNVLSDYQLLLKLGKSYEEEDFYVVRNILNDFWNRRELLVKSIRVKTKKELLFYLLVFEPNDIRTSELLADKEIQKSLKNNNVTNHRVQAAIIHYQESNSKQVFDLIEKGINWDKEVPNLGIFQLEQKALEKMKYAWFY